MFQLAGRSLAPPGGKPAGHRLWLQASHDAVRAEVHGERAEHADIDPAGAGAIRADERGQVGGAGLGDGGGLARRERVHGAHRVPLVRYRWNPGRVAAAWRGHCSRSLIAVPQKMRTLLR